MPDILTTDNWQTKSDASPAGTTFLIKSGNHRQQKLIPKNGNIYQWEAGITVDGEYASGTTYCIKGGNGIDGVQLIPLAKPYPIIKRYLVPDTDGAIEANGSKSWIVKDLDIGYCGLTGTNLGRGGMGLRLFHGWLVQRVKSHHHDQYGFGGSGDSTTLCEDCESTYNGHSQHDLNKGGMKFTNSALTWRRGVVSFNGGNGFWLDINNSGYRVEDLLAEGNKESGIFVEISQGGLILRPILRRNGLNAGALSLGYGAAIHVSASEDVEVDSPVLEMNGKGIVASQQQRTTQSPPDGAFHKLKGLWVHDGTIVQAGGIVAGVRSGIPTATYNPFSPAANNRFDRMRYQVAETNTAPFHWQGAKSWPGWQAVPQDAAGTFATFPPATPPPPAPVPPPPDSPPPPPTPDPDADPDVDPGIAIPPRVVTEDLLTVISREHVPSNDLIFLDLPNEPTYMALAHDDIQFARPGIDSGPVTWLAIGGAMIPGTAEETLDLDRQGQDVQFVAIDPHKAFAPKFLTLNMFRRRYEHWRIYWWDYGPDAGRVRAFHMPFAGYTNGKFDIRDEVDEEGFRTGNILVLFRALAPLALIDPRGMIRTNLRSHQRIYPGDLGMQHVANLQVRQIFFGSGVPSDYNPRIG